MKLEFDDDEGGAAAAENSVSKPKTPRVKKEKKEPGRYKSVLLVFAYLYMCSSYR